MTEQLVEQTTVFACMALAVLVLAFYFSPKALRHLAAWAIARATAIEFELRERAKVQRRLGLPDKKDSRKVRKLEPVS